MVLQFFGTVYNKYVSDTKIVFHKIQFSVKIVFVTRGTARSGGSPRQFERVPGSMVNQEADRPNP